MERTMKHTKIMLRWNFEIMGRQILCTIFCKYFTRREKGLFWWPIIQRLCGHLALSVLQGRSKLFACTLRNVMLLETKAIWKFWDYNPLLTKCCNLRLVVTWRYLYITAAPISTVCPAQLQSWNSWEWRWYVMQEKNICQHSWLFPTWSGNQQCGKRWKRKRGITWSERAHIVWRQENSALEKIKGFPGLAKLRHQPV